MTSQRSTPWLVGALFGLSVGLVAVLFMVIQRGHPQIADTSGEARVDTVYVMREAPATDRSRPDSTVDVERTNVIVEAIRRVRPCVVSINAVRQARQPYLSPAELLDYLRRGPRLTLGLGTGILIDHRGYVLTANHVIAGSQELSIRIADGQTFEAEVVGGSEEHDIAVIKIKGTVSGLPVAPLGDSDALQPGEWVAAIGWPFGSVVSDPQPTVTVGVVSALNREIEVPVGDRNVTYYDLIQTDALIHSGNSGGPLVNARGEVIGINSKVITDQTGSVTGLGFAVPIRRARWVADELIQHGRVRPFTFGMVGTLLTQESRARWMIPNDYPDGWLVQSVTADSPADRAGILPRDVLIRVNGQPIVDDRDRERALVEARVGTQMKLTVWRDGKTIDTNIVLAEAPGAENSAPPDSEEQ